MTTTVAEPRVYVLSFPFPDRALSRNTPGHKLALAAVRKTWRQTTYQRAINARLPKGLARVRIDVEFRFAILRDRDESNLHETAKPCVDALTERKRGPRAGVGYGLIKDDSPRYVDGPHVTIGEPFPYRRGGVLGHVTITITDLSGEAASC